MSAAVGTLWHARECCLAHDMRTQLGMVNPNLSAPGVVVDFEAQVNDCESRAHSTACLAAMACAPVPGKEVRFTMSSFIQ